MSQEPPQYTAAHLQQILAEDPRVGELGVQVVVRGDAVYLRGSVASPQRREEAAAVIAERVPQLHVHNELTLVATDGPPEVESLR